MKKRKYKRKKINNIYGNIADYFGDTVRLKNGLVGIIGDSGNWMNVNYCLEIKVDKHTTRVIQNNVHENEIEEVIEKRKPLVI